MKKGIIGFALFLGLISAAHAAEYPAVSHQEMKAIVSSGSAVIFDVNGTDSYQKGHIPGAINYETAKDNLSSVLPSDKGALIVAYCGSPMCKAYKEAAGAASEQGYTNVKHYSGGISGWKKAGEAVEK